MTSIKFLVKETLNEIRKYNKVVREYNPIPEYITTNVVWEFPDGDEVNFRDVMRVDVTVIYSSAVFSGVAPYAPLAEVKVDKDWVEFTFSYSTPGGVEL